MQLSDYRYACAAGDTFDSVALKVYGDEKYAAELLSVNAELCGKLLFTGGEKLYLPVIETVAAGEETLPQTAPWKQ